jgi:hypothetical protein
MFVRPSRPPTGPRASEAAPLSSFFVGSVPRHELDARVAVTKRVTMLRTLELIEPRGMAIGGAVRRRPDDFGYVDRLGTVSGTYRCVELVLSHRPRYRPAGPR